MAQGGWKLATVTVVCGLFLIVGRPAPTQGEWYAAGYGGLSLAGSISKAEMPVLGDARALQVFRIGSIDPNVTPNPALGDVLLKNVQSSDISLKQSPIFGAKLGHFFNKQGFPWAGIEVEAFTTQPNVKQQTVTTTQTTTAFRRSVAIADQAERIVVDTNQQPLGEARLRVTTVAFNGVLRYPDKVLQPYVGLGLGVFHFTGSTPISGSQTVPGLNVLAGLRYRMTEKFVLFAEYKYNRAAIDKLDPMFGISGNYAVTHVVTGIGFGF